MVHFVGAGCGAPDLITLRGERLLREADVVIYAGSLVNPALLGLCPEGCKVYNSAEMTLEELFSVMKENEKQKLVRLQTGDTSLFSAVREQIDLLEKAGIPYDITPGVSSFCGAAAALGVEYTLPAVSQTVIITRMAGRTPVPERERIAYLAAHGAAMVIFLSAGLLEQLQAELLEGAYTEETPAAIVYKASWPEERVVRCRLGELSAAGKRAGIRKTALIVVGDFLEKSNERSLLYDPAFSTEYREASR
ncbi:MAG: precorrin-4 C(11)-methyltransferase [Lachnospiraceae bacterium]|nr:precorrin-4 C(11)-methyltransferase [Lachnospiraceae bacterium]